jgi:hypothetical protein
MAGAAQAAHTSRALGQKAPHRLGGHVPLQGVAVHRGSVAGEQVGRDAEHAAGGRRGGRDVVLDAEPGGPHLLQPTGAALSPAMPPRRHQNRSATPSMIA